MLVLPTTYVENLKLAVTKSSERAVLSKMQHCSLQKLVVLVLRWKYYSLYCRRMFHSFIIDETVSERWLRQQCQKGSIIQKVLHTEQPAG